MGTGGRSEESGPSGIQMKIRRRKEEKDGNLRTDHSGGEEANQFFVLRQGKVTVELSAAGRKPIVIQILEGGEILGWSWLVPPYQWRFDARAIEPTRAIAFYGKCLRTQCEEDHDLGYELLKHFTTIIGERLDAASLQLLDTYGEHA